jgi:hypothetical protein
VIEAIEDLLRHAVGGRARIRNADGDDRRSDVGELVGFELEQREQAEHGQRQHRHGGDERLLDREIRDEHE